MDSFRELPIKTIPFILLLDLRRRNIRVRQELQMRIMFFTAIAETRDKIQCIVREFINLNKCSRCLLPYYVWNQLPPTLLQCNYCSLYYEHLLSIDILAESNNRHTHLDRLFNAILDSLASHVHAVYKGLNTILT